MSCGPFFPQSRVKISSWRPFGRLGFDIWNFKRKSALEVVDVPDEVWQVPSSGGPCRVGIGNRMSPEHVGFTWRSVERWEPKSNDSNQQKATILAVYVAHRVIRKAPREFCGNEYEILS